jgi:hypothetical protein
MFLMARVLVCVTRHILQADVRYTTIITPSPAANTQSSLQRLGYEYFLNKVLHSFVGNLYFYSAEKETDTC